MTHLLFVLQVLARIVEVFVLALSLSVAVVQSYVNVSGQVTRYQNVSVFKPVGTVNVWVMLLSPLVGEVPLA